jgi:hypothetical protein
MKLWLILVLSQIPAIVMMLLNLFQLWYIPRRTRKLVQLFLDDMNDTMIDRFIERFTDKAIGAIMAKMNFKQLYAQLKEAITMSALGKRSGEKKQRKAIQEAMRIDLLGQTNAGKWLLQFPTVRAKLEKQPKLVEYFVKHMAPKIEAQNIGNKSQKG